MFEYKELIMIEEIKNHLEKVKKQTFASAEEVESFRIKYLGKKGVLNALFKEFKNVPNTDKKSFGQALNELKVSVESKVNKSKH